MGTARPRTNQLNALDLLIEQHDKVEALIEELESEDTPEEQKPILFRELANNLAAHSTMEEKLFYPSVRAVQTEEILLESTEEHLAIKRVLADLMELEPGDPRFEAKLSVLKEEVEHHAREEEEDILFPKLRRLMGTEQLAALGSEMLALFERLMATEPRLQVPKETRKAAPL
jgi:hemerythrin superfamily protein